MIEHSRVTAATYEQAKNQQHIAHNRARSHLRLADRPVRRKEIHKLKVEEEGERRLRKMMSEISAQSVTSRWQLNTTN